MSKAAKWAIGIGVLLAFLGMVGITAGFPSRQTDPGPIAAGLAVFALGLLAVTATFYFEARSIRSQLPVDANPRGSARRKHSCDVCHNAPAVILCTMHKTACVQHVCPVITIPAVAYTFLLFAEQAPDLPKALPHRAVSYSPHQQ